MNHNRLHPFLQLHMDKHESLHKQEIDLGIERAPSGMGYLTVIGSRRGEIVFVDRGKNLVVNTGRSGLAHLIAGDSVDTHKIVSMKFGDGTTPPVVSDTTLSGTTIIEKPTSYDFPDGSTGLKVRFTAVVPEDEGNGSGTQNYREAALIKANGDIFSRKLLGGVAKDNTLLLTALWTIIF